MKGPPEKAAGLCRVPRWDGTTPRDTCGRVTRDREEREMAREKSHGPAFEAQVVSSYPTEGAKDRAASTSTVATSGKGRTGTCQPTADRVIGLAPVQAASELLVGARAGLWMRYRGIDLLLPAASSSTRCSWPTATTVSPDSPSPGGLICTP